MIEDARTMNNGTCPMNEEEKQARMKWLAENRPDIVEKLAIAARLEAIGEQTLATSLLTKHAPNEHFCHTMRDCIVAGRCLKNPCCTE